MALQGAEILCMTHTFAIYYVMNAFSVYPTAIGSEPQDPTIDSAAHWERAMVGHSASNLVPVVASNRIGTETFSRSEITFYGM